MAELYGVVQKVIQNLLDFAHIRIHIHGIAGEDKLNGNFLFTAGALKGGSRIPDDFVDVKVGLVQKHSLGI